MTASERYNARKDALWHDVHVLERERRAQGLEPNRNLDHDGYFAREASVEAAAKLNRAALVQAAQEGAALGECDES